MVVERRCYCDPKALLTLVIEERDVRSAFLPVEKVYPKFVDLLDDDHRERPPADRVPGLGEVGGL